MTLRDYLGGMSAVLASNPQMLDMEVVYSHDDEGNNFQKVQATPEVVKFIESHGEYVDMDDNGEPMILIN